MNVCVCNSLRGVKIIDDIFNIKVPDDVVPVPYEHVFFHLVHFFSMGIIRWDANVKINESVVLHYDGLKQQHQMPVVLESSHRVRFVGWWMVGAMCDVQTVVDATAKPTSFSSVARLKNRQGRRNNIRPLGECSAKRDHGTLVRHLSIEDRKPTVEVEPDALWVTISCCSLEIHTISNIDW